MTETDAPHVPIVVIGLPRRQDRRTRLEAALRDEGGVPALFAADLGLVADWRDWSAADVEALRARAFPWCDSESPIGLWNRHLKLGEIACTLSHWNVWTYAVAENWSAVMILEDDAAPAAGFAGCPRLLAELAAHESGWDLLYLGRRRILADQPAFGPFTRPGFSYCTYGYAVSHGGLRKLLRTDVQNAIIPADEFLPAMCMEHPRERVRARFPPVLSAYGLVQDVVHQLPKEEFGSDTEASPFLEPLLIGS